MVKKTNALTFDLEYWWDAEFLKPYVSEKRDDRIKESVDSILAVLNKNHSKATFFIQGSVAEKYPDIIDLIATEGHEIGSHAYSHERLHDLGKKRFDEEIKKSVDILGSYDCIGFRAPSFSVDNSVIWYLDILEKYDFKYDSSIFPVKTRLYGIPKAPLTAYKPSRTDIASHDPDALLLEFPLSALSFVKNIPVAGGFYFRMIPGSLFNYCITHIAKSRPAVLYFHPWELYSSLPQLEVPLLNRIVTYYGIESSLTKFESLLGKFAFKPLKEFLP